MNEKLKMCTCERCGKPTPNYHEYSPSLAAIVGVQGSSWCDECRREIHILHEWENEQETDERMICPYCGDSISDPWEYEEGEDEIECPNCDRTFKVEISSMCPRDLAHKLYDERLLPFGVQVYCPDGGGALRLTYDLQMQAVKSLREDSTLCLLWAMLMDSYSRWRTTGDVFNEASD